MTTLANSKQQLFAFGDGFHDDEGTWRWMGPTGHLRIPSQVLPAEVYFELSCGQPERYDLFPFELRVIVDNKLLTTLAFQEDERTQIVELQLPASKSDVQIRLESGQFFVPSKRGVSADLRQLSVRLSRLQVDPVNEEAAPLEFLRQREEPSSGAADTRGCPLCSEIKDLSSQLLGWLDSARGVGPKQYVLLQCSNCQLIYLSPLPQKEVFEDLYIGNTQFADGPQYAGKRAELANKYYRERFLVLFKRIGVATKPVRVLEIGSGLSWMSQAAKSVKPESITVAQDITAEAVEICKWVDHYVVGELSSKIDQIKHYGPYHVISMTHVIEHLPDPIAVLKLCASLLDQKGIIFITAPYRPKLWGPQSPFSRWRRWSYNHVPAHLQYFNAASMKRCAENSQLEMVRFEATAEEGQAFEAWLCLRESELPERWTSKVKRFSHSG